MMRLIPRSAMRFVASTVLATWALLCPVTFAQAVSDEALGEPVGVDPMRATRLMIRTGYLADVDRLPGMFRNHLVDLDVPDDGEPRVGMAIISTLAPAQVRERWLEYLSGSLTERQLVAAEEFYGSVPGSEFVRALRATREAPGSAATTHPQDPARRTALLIGADAREWILLSRTRGAALWASRTIAERHRRFSMDQALEDAASSLAAPSPDAVLAAMARLDPLHASALTDFANTAEGAGFHIVMTEALDAAVLDVIHSDQGRYANLPLPWGVERERPPLPAIMPLTE